MDGLSPSAISGPGPGAIRLRSLVHVYECESRKPNGISQSLVASEYWRDRSPRRMKNIPHSPGLREDGEGGRGRYCNENKGELEVVHAIIHCINIQQQDYPD